VVSQYKLVSGCGLLKRRSAPPTGLGKNCTTLHAIISTLHQQTGMFHAPTPSGLDLNISQKSRKQTITKLVTKSTNNSPVLLQLVVCCPGTNAHTRKLQIITYGNEFLAKIAKTEEIKLSKGSTNLRAAAVLRP